MSSAVTIFNGAELSNAERRINGSANPDTTTFDHGSGCRSMGPSRTRSATRTMSTSSLTATSRMPTPRTSSLPRNVGGAVAMRRGGVCDLALVSITWSSATSFTGFWRSTDCPSAMHLRARSDFPAPDGPRISTPRLPTAIAVAWTRSAPPDKAVSHRDGPRKAHCETRALARGRSFWRAVLGEYLAVVAHHDLARD